MSWVVKRSRMGRAVFGDLIQRKTKVNTKNQKEKLDQFPAFDKRISLGARGAPSEGVSKFFREIRRQPAGA